MKLLLDQNISHHVVKLLSDIFPESSHVREHRLERADDEAVWEFAKKHGYIIVSKDIDFYQRSFLFGFPPKIIWIRKGNCSTDDIVQLIRRRMKDVQRFYEDKEASFLALS